jgi:hypothetical protein
MNEPTVGQVLRAECTQEVLGVEARADRGDPSGVARSG